MTKFLNISTDNTLGGSSPSNEVVSSQKANKEYIDNNSIKDVKVAGSSVVDNNKVANILAPCVYRDWS